MKSLKSVLLIVTMVISQIFGEISNGEIDMSRRLQTNVSVNMTEADTMNMDKILNLKTLPEFSTFHTSSSGHNSIQNFTNLIRISDILDVFDLEQIGADWDVVGQQIGTNCSTDMTDYLQGLKTGKIWAIKSKLFTFTYIMFSCCVVEFTRVSRQLLCKERVNSY